MNVVFFTFFAAVAPAQIQPQPKPPQASYGTCSPNIGNVSGNVTIQFSGGCSGIDPTAVKAINEFLAKFPKTQDRLQELLDKKDLELNLLNLGVKSRVD